MYLLPTTCLTLSSRAFSLAPARRPHPIAFGTPAATNRTVSATDNISPLLGSLISLVRLALGHNKLTGPLPDSLGNLINLQFLSVEHNRLTGHIPIILCRLFTLETFNASNNQLDGTIPAGIGGLEKLKRLDLGHNRLTGEIPSGICTLKFLSWLRLDNNQLTGPIPDEIGRLRNLIILNLSSNQLSGRVPEGLGTLSDLISGDLRGNLLEGGLPFPAGLEVASGMVGLRTLDMGFNNLDLPFPGLKGLVQLRTLAMDHNRVHGELGESLAEGCPNLFKLHLQNNKLSGQASRIYIYTHVLRVYISKYYILRSITHGCYFWPSDNVA